MVADAQTRRLLVLYDDTCGICLAARDWLLRQPMLVEMVLLPAGDPKVRRRYAEAIPTLGEELVVVDQDGRVWTGPDAFLTCLWATSRYRGWAYRLSRGALEQLAARFFRRLSERRKSWGRWLGREPCERCAPVSTQASSA